MYCLMASVRLTECDFRNGRNKILLAMGKSEARVQIP